MIAVLLLSIGALIGVGTVFLATGKNRNKAGTETTNAAQVEADEIASPAEANESDSQVAADESVSQAETSENAAKAEADENASQDVNENASQTETNENAEQADGKSDLKEEKETADKEVSYNTAQITGDLVGSNSSIEVIRIGKDVATIEDGSFSGLTGLKEIIADEANPYFASFNGCLYNKDFSQLLCIPQNTATVEVKKTITSRTEHALDGLTQSRKDKVDTFLRGKDNSVNSDQKSQSETGQKSADHNEANHDQDIQTQQSPEVSQPQEMPAQETVSGPSVQSNTDFSQYVFTASDGSTRFKYTGHGDSAVIVPEGVEVIEAFANTAFERNTDITYIYLPASLKSIACRNIRFMEEYGWDKNTYCVLYQCPNLRTVEGGCWSDWGWNYRGMGDYIIRPQGIIEWSTDSLIPYDRSRYH